MTRRLLPLALLTALAYCTANVARADRPPTTDESAAILAGFGAWSDASCYDVRVAEVDATWARVTFASPLPSEAPEQFLSRCNPADGLTVIHHGVLEYQDAYTRFRARVRLRASARQQCRSPLVYLRLRVSGVTRRDRQLLGGLAGTNNLTCF